MMGTALSGLLEMCLATACLLPHSSPATDPDPHVGPQIIGLSHAKLARVCACLCVYTFMRARACKNVRIEQPE